MWEEDGSSAALAPEYNSIIPMRKIILQGGASAQSEPYQSLVDITTLMDSAVGAERSLYEQQPIVISSRTRRDGHSPCCQVYIYFFK